MKTKRFLASLLALLMLFSLLPTLALAEEPGAEEPDAQAPRDETQDGLTGWFLVGSMNSWTPNEDFRFALNADNPLQFVLQCNLSEGDEFKGALVENGTITQWFPDPGNNYKVQAEQEGYKAVYFRPNDTGDWDSNFLIDDIPVYHVSTHVNNFGHGSISVSPQDAYKGDIITVTVTPDAGYFLTYIEPWGITKVNDTTFTFEMPGSDTTVNATFMLAPGYYFDNTNRTVPDNYVPEEAFSPSTSAFGEWERETTLTAGNYLDVFAAYAPENANDRTGYYWNFQTTKLTYSSASNRPSVTAEQAGHAMVFLTETEREGYIKAIHLQRSYYGESYTWDAWITVKNFHPITVETAANGSVTADLTEAYEGQTVVLTATPASGYRLGAYTVLDADNNEIPVDGSSFSMPDKAVTVTATFVADAVGTYTVTVLGSTEGCAVTADKETAQEGETVTLTVTADSTHQLESLTAEDADGNPVELTQNGNTYTFLMQAANVTVTAVSKEVYPLWLGETQVTSLNKDNILGDGVASYDPGTKTLHFTSSEPAITGLHENALLYADNLNLTVDAPQGLKLSTNAENSYGISMVKGSLTVNGNLEIFSTNTNIYASKTPFILNGDLTISGSVHGLNVNSIKIFGNVEAEAGRNVLYGMDGTTEITGDSIHVVSTDGSNTSMGIYGYQGVTLTGSVNVESIDTCVKAGYGVVTINGEATLKSNTWGIEGFSVIINGNLNMETGRDGIYVKPGSGVIDITGNVNGKCTSNYSYYAILSGQNITVDGDLTAESKGYGVKAENGGVVTVAGGTWTLDGGVSAIYAVGGIVIPETHSIVEPVGGVIGQVGSSYRIMEADGTTTATHVVISGAASTVTVTFDPCIDNMEHETIVIPAGGSIETLPTPTRTDGWVFVGWYMTPAQKYLDAGQGIQVTTATTFDADTTVYAHWRLPGDVNGDAQVNFKDLTRLQRYLKYGDVDVVVPNLDVNGDGTSNFKDLTRLQRYLKYNDVEIH